MSCSLMPRAFGDQIALVKNVVLFHPVELHADIEQTHSSLLTDASCFWKALEHSLSLKMRPV